MSKGTDKVHGQTCAALRASRIKVCACGAVAIGLAILNPVAVQGANNPEYQVRLVVNTMARWVQHPAQPNLPPYFKAELKSVSISVEFEGKGDDKDKSTLAEAVPKEVLRGLSSMQPEPHCQTSADWIIVPQGQGPEFSRVDNLFGCLLSYQGQNFRIATLPLAGKENADPVPLELRTDYITVYKVQTITITVNASSNRGMPATVLLEKVWNGMPKGASERQIPIEIYQSESNCKRPGATKIAERTASAVARLYEQLYAVGLKINSFSPAPQTPYSKPLQDWGGRVADTPVTAQFIPATGELRISDLPVVQKVALSDDYATKFPALQERLSARACGELVGFPLTPEGKATFQYLAEQDPAVKTAAVKNNEGVLTLAITPQQTFAHLNGSAGPSYNNQTGWTGKANVTGQDLIRSENLYDLSNSTQISYQGGGSYQDASASFSVSKPSRDPSPRVEFYSLSLGGSFTQNQNDRFGGILPGQTLTVSDTQATAGLKLSYDSFSIFDSLEAANLFPAGRKLNRHQILLPVAFGFDRFLAKSNHGTYRSSGDLFQVSISPEYTYTHDFDSQGKTRGWNAFIVAATAEYIKGKNATASLGFDRYLAGVTITATAGLQSTRQFLFRGQYQVGSLSAGGPVVRTFQLGGTQWVPGLQFGEDSGQSLGFAQGEAGIDIPSVLKLFGRNVPRDTPLFEVRSSYLKMVFSRALVSQRESVAAVAGLGSGAESFGPAVEIGRLKQTFNLTAGYMYSPQSALHTHGTIFLTVTMTDYRLR
jgi:hypothetical protein